MSKKFYFRTLDDEVCYHLENHMDDAKDEGLAYIELYQAQRENVNGMFYCTAVNECTEEGMCGKICDDYSPKNGKSGICRHKAKFYTAGKKVRLKVK